MLPQTRSSEIYMSNEFSGGINSVLLDIVSRNKKLSTSTYRTNS
jgi:hypothetical protein